MAVLSFTERGATILPRMLSEYGPYTLIRFRLRRPCPRAGAPQKLG
jgi:hypothetical protein